MTELSGTLQGLGLPAIIRFLGGLKKSGCLRITEHGWEGEIFFEEGQVREARLGTRRGLAVLDALVETFSNGSFVFDSQAILTAEPSIRLSPEALQAHLEEISARVAKDRCLLPHPDAVLAHRLESDADGHDEPLVLDRGALQTLLSIDGERSVRELVAQRGTFDVLWQVATLTAAGLVEPVNGPAEPERVVDTTRRRHGGDAALMQALHAESEPVHALSPGAAPQGPVTIEPAQLAVPQPARSGAAGHCPSLGFADDSSSSFDRPTRLHRCFAAGTPMPLSLDQQRELCLTDDYRTCPRLTTVAPSAGESDDSRIVRLPLAPRHTPPAREAYSLGAGGGPGRLRSAVSASVDTSDDRPRPLRDRIDRVTARAAAPSPAASASSRSGAELVAGARALLSRPVPLDDDAPAPRTQSRDEMQAQLDDLVERPAPNRRLAIAARVAVLVLAVGVLAYGAIALLRRPSAAPSADPVLVASSSLAESADVAPTAVQPALSQPTTVVVPDSAATTVPATTVAWTTATGPGGPSASTPKLLFNDYFSTNSGWPSSPDGVASIVNGTYRLAPARAGQFVAIGAPITNLPADVIVNASYHKLTGPSGGGYGLIVRDQGVGARDGTSQDGRYYVVEVGDKGEVGMWRRELDHWVDLLAWQASDAVKPNNATNDLTVRAIGNTLTLLVNGVQVATKTDSTFTNGGVGLFVGGDGNQVAVDHFSVQTP